MHLIKNSDEITILVNDEAAENILSILRLDDDWNVGSIWSYSDSFMEFITAAMEVVVTKTMGKVHDVIILTKTEAHGMIIELFHEIMYKCTKKEIDAIRDSANTRYAALLGKNGLLPAMVAVGIVEKEVADLIYHYNGNNNAAIALLLKHIKDIPGVAIRHSFIDAYGQYQQVCSAVHKSVVYPTDPSTEIDSDQVEDDNNTSNN